MALERLDDVCPARLEAFEDAHPDLLTALYPYAPRHMLLRHELDELFDTSADLSGADIDISRYIRSGAERDVSVFWFDVPKGALPAPASRPSRDALCAVPFLRAGDQGEEVAPPACEQARMGLGLSGRLVARG